MDRPPKLKHMLTIIHKSYPQNLHAYLHEIKTIADNLISGNSPVP